MYIGLAPYKIDKNSAVVAWTKPDEIPKQIRLLRTIPEIKGSAFYSSKHFLRDLLSFQDSLKQNFYRYPAIVPPMNWIDSIPPAPVLKIKKSGKKVKWETELTFNKMDKPNLFVIYKNEKGMKFDAENPVNIWGIVKESEIKFEKINKRKEKYEIRISVLGQLNNESKLSEPVILKL